jgi:hypothetical protein
MVVSPECGGYSDRSGVKAMPMRADSALSLPGGLIDANMD